MTFNLSRSHIVYALTALLLSWCYATLRFQLNIEFSGATWEQLYLLEAPLPFGSRILVPILSRPIVWMGFSVWDAFFFWEVVATFMLVMGLYMTFKLHTDHKWSMTLSLVFLLVLPLVYLLRFRWPIYYPYDTPAMAGIAWGIYLMLKGTWWPFIALVFVATLNRESSILLLLLFGATYIDRLKISRFIFALSSMIAAYLTARWITHLLTAGNPMPYHGNLAFLLDGDWRFRSNVIWLLNLNNIPVLLATLAGLPLLVLAFARHIPPHMRRYGIVVLTYFAMLLFVGNLYEPRIFGEIVVILFVASSLATLRWLQAPGNGNAGLQLLGDGNLLIPWVARLERHAALIIMFAAALAMLLLDRLGVDHFFK